MGSCVWCQRKQANKIKDAQIIFQVENQQGGNTKQIEKIKYFQEKQHLHKLPKSKSRSQMFAELQTKENNTKPDFCESQISEVRSYDFYFTLILIKKNQIMQQKLKIAHNILNLMGILKIILLNLKDALDNDFIDLYHKHKKISDFSQLQNQQLSQNPIHYTAFVFLAIIEETTDLDQLQENIQKVFIQENFVYVEDENKLLSIQYSFIYQQYFEQYQQLKYLCSNQTIEKINFITDEFQQFLQTEAKVKELYDLFLGECIKGIEKIQQGQLCSQYFDGLYFSETDEFIYKNIIILEINDATGTEYENLKKEVSFNKILNQSKLYNQVLVPLGAIFRLSEEQFYLCETILPITRGNICYGSDTRSFLIYNDIQSNTQLDEQEKIQLKEIIKKIQSKFKIKIKGFNEQATKTLKLCDFPLGLMAIKNNQRDGLQTFSFVRTKMLAKKIMKNNSNQYLILRPELINLFSEKIYQKLPNPFTSFYEFEKHKIRLNSQNQSNWKEQSKQFETEIQENESYLRKYGTHKRQQSKQLEQIQQQIGVLCSRKTKSLFSKSDLSSQTQTQENKWKKSEEIGEFRQPDLFNEKELGEFLQFALIPHFISKLKNKEILLESNKQLVNLMQIFGINVQFLGKIYEGLNPTDEILFDNKKQQTLVNNLPVEQFTNSDFIVHEIIARTLKNLVIHSIDCQDPKILITLQDKIKEQLKAIYERNQQNNYLIMAFCQKANSLFGYPKNYEAFFNVPLNFELIKTMTSELIEKKFYQFDVRGEQKHIVMLKNSQCDSLSLKLFLHIFKKQYKSQSDKLQKLFDNFLMALKQNNINQSLVEILSQDFNSFIKKFKNH